MTTKESALKLKQGDLCNSWTILGRAFSLGYKDDWYFVCECSCGTVQVVSAKKLRYNESKQCLECARVKNGAYATEDPLLYRVWSGMNTRCYNKKNKDYPRYGERGITICQEWLDDPNKFFSWAKENGWEPGLLIDRENNDLGYSPYNCRFVTAKVSSNNRSSNKRGIAFGEEKTLAEWSDDPRCVVPRYLIYMRIERGWDLETAISRLPGGRTYAGA